MQTYESQQTSQDSLVVTSQPQFFSVTLNSIFIWGLVAGSIWKWFIEPQIEKCTSSLNYSLSQEQIFRDEVNRILVKTHADRVLLYFPHNGEICANTFHKWKLSVMAEATAPGVISLRSKHQNIDVSEMFNTAQEIKSSKEVIYGPENLPLDQEVKNVMNEFGIKKIVVQAVGSENKFFILVLHYGDEKPHNLPDISSHVNRIRAVLDRTKQNPFIRLSKFLMKKG